MRHLVLLRVGLLEALLEGLQRLDRRLVPPPLLLLAEHEHDVHVLERLRLRVPAVRAREKVALQRRSRRECTPVLRSAFSRHPSASVSPSSRRLRNFSKACVVVSIASSPVRDAGRHVAGGDDGPGLPRDESAGAKEIVQDEKPSTCGAPCRVEQDDPVGAVHRRALGLRDQLAQIVLVEPHIVVDAGARVADGKSQRASAICAPGLKNSTTTLFRCPLVSQVVIAALNDRRSPASACPG